MKIAIVSPEFPPDIGGVEIYAYELCQELVRRGHEVVVFTTPHPEGEISLPNLRVIPRLSFEQDRDTGLFDAVQADVWHVLNAGYAWVALSGRPTVVSIHGNDFLRAYIPCAPFSLETLPIVWRMAERLKSRLRPYWLRRNQRLLARALPKARSILANSHYTEVEFLKRHPECRGLTSVIHVGVSERFFSVQREAKGTGPTRLLSVCRLAEQRKNIDRVLAALAILKDRHEFEYVVAGDGRMRPALEEQARSLGLSGRVRFVGRVSDAELMALYGAADLFVLAASVIPGSHEGFGIVYLEAAASGVPSLAARLAGAVEAVEEGKSGYFVDSPDVDSLAQALERFLSGGLHFDAESCRDFARRFRWSRITDLALSAYGAAVTPAVHERRPGGPPS